MEQVDVSDYARRLFAARGPKAVAEAAQKAANFERQGDSAQAKVWRKIEAALLAMRGPSRS